MGNFLFNFKRLQIENSDPDQFQLATTTIGGSFAEDSGRGSAGTYRRLSADCESCRRSISPSEGYASGSQASVETVNEVENNQLVHYGISRENQSKIKRMFIDMKDSIDIDGILDRFIQDGDLTEDAQEKIMFNNPRRKQVELFLFRLFRFKRDAFDRFVQYIREDECLVHIADQLQKGIKLPALETARLKPHKIRPQIEHHMEDILREIEPDEVAEYFMVYEVCEVNEYEEVVSEKKTTRAKGLALLHLLILNHIPRGYQVFLTALRELNRTGLLQKLKKRHISTPLRQDVESTRSIVTAKFTFGNQSDMLSLDQIVGGPSGYSLRCTRATQCDEEDLVENLRRETVKAEINRRLISETNTMLYDTTSGSLIFHLKWTSQAWRQLSIDRLREIVGTVVRILMEEGNKVDTESQTWNVEVCAIPSTLNVRSSTTDPKDSVEVITEHKEFLATELNGLRIAEQMNESGVLSSDDLSDVRGKSDRRLRAEALLNKITNSGETSAKAFLEELTKAGPRYHFITRHLWPENDDDLCWMANNMGTIYPLLIEGLPAIIMSQHQHELGLPDECIKNDDVVATSMQYIMAQGNEIKFRFLLLLLEKQIVPKDFYTRIRSKMPDDNIASDRKQQRMNSLQTDTTSRVRLGHCIVVKEIGANDAYQVPECTGTIGHWWLLSAIRKYIVKLIFCEGFVVNSRERVMPERLGPTPIPCAENAGYANDAEVLESSEVRKNDD